MIFTEYFIVKKNAQWNRRRFLGFDPFQNIFLAVHVNGCPSRDGPPLPPPGRENGEECTYPAGGETGVHSIPNTSETHTHNPFRAHNKASAGSERVGTRAQRTHTPHTSNPWTAECRSEENIVCTKGENRLQRAGMRIWRWKNEMKLVRGGRKGGPNLVGHPGLLG
ncbi:hypothetical protein AVEN_275777-1 [Araneus ventricosus]|uniref:Uncharacterized protein n=1 Tax=Araneus ventricosus TaxID=182803 RepID=A0A4Y2HEM4_ARAVE|nr:hypothetical protein AVEN_275777-1 [Araneus ventricosus]